MCMKNSKLNYSKKRKKKNSKLEVLQHYQITFLYLSTTGCDLTFKKNNNSVNGKLILEWIKKKDIKQMNANEK